MQAAQQRAVSIHAPVMDAKLTHFLPLRQTLGFNPRARDGREPLALALCHKLARFNPRARDGRELKPLRIKNEY